MGVRYLLIPEIGDVTESEVSSADWRVIRVMLTEHLGEPPEHVAVLFEGARRDMFVGETSAINGRVIRNIRGTEIYRNNTMTRSPRTDPESLPAVSGPAVLFPDEIVWR